MVTVAPATTALEGSVTVPVTLAELPTCAKPAGAVTNVPKKRNKIPRNDFANLINVSPIMNCSLAPSCAGSLDECENPHPPRFTVDAWGKLLRGIQIRQGERAEFCDCKRGQDLLSGFRGQQFWRPRRASGFRSAQRVGGLQRARYGRPDNAARRRSAHASAQRLAWQTGPWKGSGLRLAVVWLFAWALPTLRDSANNNTPMLAGV
jgi:hypothetical protein